MIKDSRGATSRTLSPPVHLQRPVAALSLAEEGSVQHGRREIRRRRTVCSQILDVQYYAVNKRGQS